MLGTGARLCLDRWHGDLRRLHREAEGDPAGLRRRLTEFPGIGPTGADIYLREAQAVWSDVRPYADRRALAGAKRLGLPADPDGLAGLVDEPDFGRLASALVRVALGRGVGRRGHPHRRRDPLRCRRRRAPAGTSVRGVRGAAFMPSTSRADQQVSSVAGHSTGLSPAGLVRCHTSTAASRANSTTPPETPPPSSVELRPVTPK